MTRKNAFTLIELLVVIAIIAILAAIIFPVFMKAKESAYRSGDMTNMNNIRTALQLYRADQEAYPPQILGYATFYNSGPQNGQVIPANLLKKALYPKRIDSIETMRPAYDRERQNIVVPAEWPNKDPRALGQAPVKDLNGDGVIDTNDDSNPNARQAWASGFTAGSKLYFCIPGPAAPGCSLFSTSDVNDVRASGAEVYAVSGYDVGFVKIPPVGNTRYELRYTLRWSNYALSGGHRMDDPRQLIYSEPPDDTVVTWNSWFRTYDPNTNLPNREKKDFVLFLGGTARPYDSMDLYDRSWRVTP